MDRSSYARPDALMRVVPETMTDTAANDTNDGRLVPESPAEDSAVE